VSQVTEPLVRLRDLHVTFALRGGFLGSLAGGEKTVRAVDGVSLELHPGETLGLVGESGSGKTTLGRAVLRLVEPASGTVTFGGRDITHLPERDLRPLRRHMQPVFQDAHAALNPAMTIGEAVAHPLRVQRICPGREEARQRAAEMLARVGISPPDAFLDRFPEDLSGGQKQRVVLARALVTRPRLVVADEPVAMLDMSVRALVLRLLRELRGDLGLTYLFITHDLATARLLCDRVAVMYLGRVVEIGPAASVLGQPRHPYTRALLEAVPRPDPAARTRGRRLPEGEVPDATDVPPGCRFHPRCPEVFAPCPAHDPVLQPAGGVEVACHLYGLTDVASGKHPAMEPEEHDGDGLVEKVADKMRGTGVGTEDPNIVGDVGPTDVPPGKDPDTEWPPPDPEPQGERE
jgi:oligopeptide/dipeptide ABC transporter ATP-binding protein